MINKLILGLFLIAISPIQASNEETQFNYEANHLIVLPDDRIEGVNEKDAFIQAIDSAKHTVFMSTYKLHDHVLPEAHMLAAVERAVKRGVTVKILAENKLIKIELLDGKKSVKAGDALKAYEKAGAEVLFHQKDFKQIHNKYIVVDGKIAIFGTTNFDKDFKIRQEEGSDKRGSRDFAIVIKDELIISDLSKMFLADVEGKDFNPRAKKFIKWGPGHLREFFKDLIKSAKKSIRIYQQDITDKDIIATLTEAAKQGIEVELLMSSHPFGFNRPDNNKEHQEKLKQVGASVYLTKYITHAKIIVIDDEQICMSSCNFYQPAIDNSRNVSYLLKDKEVVDKILETMKVDKKTADVL